MKLLVLVYEDFAEFEVTLLGFVARQEGNDVVTAGLDDAMRVRGLGGLTVVADIPLGAVKVEDYEALVVPGGTPEILIDRQDVGDLIRSFDRAGKIVAAICMAPIHLARAGVLAGRSFTTSASQNWRGVFDWPRKLERPVVTDGNIITAQGPAFVEFSLTLMERLGAYRQAEHARLWREELSVQEPGPS
ncbi:MAG: DJ-1/PfpI family protein [bacterium]|nr:DJ-1/PfpI family protein [bacterium]